MRRAPDEPPPSVTFGPAHADEVQALVVIDSTSPQAWTREAFIAELTHEPKTLFVLRSGHEVLAFVVTRVHVPEMDIVNLAVSFAHRRRGLGRFLLRSLLSHPASKGVRSVFLEVRAGNEAARRHYTAAGFKETQRRSGFYKDPLEDAILMRLEPPEPLNHLIGPRSAC